MVIDKCIEKIDKHIHKEGKTSLFINVNNNDDYNAIYHRYNNGIKYISISDFSDYDNFPRFDEFLLALNGKETKFVFGLSSYLRYFDFKEFESRLFQFIDINLNNNSIVILYQCESYLNKIKDPRVTNHIIMVDGVKSRIPNLVLLKKGMGNAFDTKVNGINNSFDFLEKNDCETLYIESKFSKNEIGNCCYSISEIKSYFDIVRSKYVQRLNDGDIGITNNWEVIANKCMNLGSYKEYIKSLFSRITDPTIIFQNWNVYNDERKIALFIYVKFFDNSIDNPIITYAFYNSNTINDILKNVYRSLCDTKIDKNYWDKYELRKQILKSVGFNEHDANEFCSYISNFNEKSLYYLTDMTEVEKCKIIEIISKFYSSIGDDKVCELLGHIYPDLLGYLRFYDYKNDLLNNYFNLYKYSKLYNYIPKELKEIVDKEAVERNYNLLPTRSEVVFDLNKSKSILYFVDALGIEYMSYISYIASKLGMMISTKICHCEIPSITSMNKEFLDEFRKAGADVVDNIKDLDELKHHGELDYNYDKNPLPTYLQKELSIISNVLGKININLGTKYDRAYIISDHGASRLAVIGKNETKWEMINKGEHCGRCCKVSDNIVDVPTKEMIEGNNYWVLANYDSIKGGRPGTVEVHGGATLEEVCIPVIELIRKPDNIRLELLKSEITIKYGEKTYLELVSNVNLYGVHIIINGKNYIPENQDGMFFKVDISDLRRAKTYEFDIMSNDNYLDKLTFKIKPYGMVSNDIL